MGKVRGWKKGDIQTASNIGGYRYLHYWFYHSGITPRDFSMAKQATLIEQRAIFKDRQKAMISGDELEGYKILNDIALGKNVGNLLDQKVGEIFGQSYIPTGASSSGVGGYSWAQIGAMNYRGATRGLAEKFANEASNCQTHLQAALDQINQIFGKAYPQLQRQALLGGEQYFNNTDVRTVIQDFLISGNKILQLDGNISTDKQSIMQSIARLTAIVNAIPLLTSTKVKGLYYTSSHGSGRKTVTTRSQLISVLLGKIGGILSSLGGSIEEIAVGYGLEAAIQEGCESILHAVPTFTGGIVTMDPQLKNDARPLEGFTFNKNDVTLIATGKNVVCTFGASVKTTQAVNAQGIPVDIKIHSGINLNTVLNSLKKEGINDYYIYNLAGGVEEGYKGGMSLQQAWRSMVDYAVALNFLDFLAGKGYANNNNLIVIANRQIYPIQKILMGVARNPEAINYTGGKQRSTFWKINEKNYVKTGDRQLAAEQRSNRTWAEINQAFQSTKMNISLNLAAALSY